MRPVAHTLAELAGLLDRRAAVEEHLAEAVAVARAWEARDGRPRPAPRCRRRRADDLVDQTADLGLGA
jgi:hypothetical protein